MDDLVQSQHALTVGDLSGRSGFDERFLGVRVGISALVESVLLPYIHISVLMWLDNAWRLSPRSELTAPS